ncbi:MAG: FAD-dependent dehydrogenase [Bacteroidia bacterium]|nr:MAG: FAD-dependent dehydrogenase [Bacteroidia bacterium]
MLKTFSIQIPFFKINDDKYIRSIIQQETGLENFYYTILKKSIDARKKPIKINLKVLVDTTPITREINQPVVKDISNSSPIVHIVGAGPAGLFAALRCLELGIKPVIFEQGKMVRDRRRDLANITKNGIVNPYSNYCFGEGGAGTYSDGKLYTRSDKRGDVDTVLNYLVYFGASTDILVDAHPHIGTNKLPHIIEFIRTFILQNGGEIYFQHQLINFNLSDDKTQIKSILVKDLIGQKILEIPCNDLILATGHSARSIYRLLHEKQIYIEFKPFAIGVRVEHPQDLVDSIQYHCATNSEVEYVRSYLPAARYTLVHTTQEFSAYSFCMCPGGIIAPCATDVNEVVTNGWSPSKRNNPFANSGIVVAINEKIIPDSKNNPLAGMHYQQEIERVCFNIGGKNLFAPAQRITDFVNNKESASLPDCSYRPGVTSAHLKECLPSYVYTALKEAFITFNKKMRGYITEQAIVVAPESRTSSPVRIPRNKETLQHVQVKNLYPCAEGSGYAGGIVSAAIDGMNVVNAIAKKIGV